MCYRNIHRVPDEGGKNAELNDLNKIDWLKQALREAWHLLSAPDGWDVEAEDWRKERLSWIDHTSAVWPEVRDAEGWCITTIVCKNCAMPQLSVHPGSCEELECWRCGTMNPIPIA